MTGNLLELVIATGGGHELWKALHGLRIDISIGGPIWAMKGWPPEKTFDQILTLDTVKEHIVLTPVTRPDQQMVFDAATDSVTMETLDGQPVDKLNRGQAVATYLESLDRRPGLSGGPRRGGVSGMG